jgi:hypothetical protein
MQGQQQPWRFEDSENVNARTWSGTSRRGTYNMSPGSTMRSTMLAWRANGKRSKSGASGRTASRTDSVRLAGIQEGVVV